MLLHRLRALLGDLRPKSLRSRLTLGIVAVLAVVLFLGGAYVAREADRTERQSVDDRLARTAELLDKIAEDLANGGAANASPAEVREERKQDIKLSRVLRATRSSLIISVFDEPVYEQGVRLPPLAPTPLGFTTREVGGRRLRIFTKIVVEDGIGGAIRLQATADLSQAESRQVALRRRLLVVGAVMLLLAGLATSVAAGYVLRPLRRLRDEARGIEGESDLDTRLPTAGPREISALAGSFNAMLRRLQRSADDRSQALDATRRFAADVGHEIRTPLTSVQAALSTIHRHPDVPADTRSMMIDEALGENRRLVLLLDGLQALARGDANSVAQADVDLASVVAEAVAATQQGTTGATLVPDLPDDAVVVRGWEPGLRSLVDNLLRNAVRHGRPDGRVVVALRPGSPVEGPCLVVEDDGDGIAPEERERVFEPFARAAGTVAPGSGLGLAIVAQQARHHDAIVAIEDAPTGGARFVVRFPRSA
ncbi:ATP-binding protein [Patulibacter sp.]|uniref:sensor histidine kinase n=1 Tax=Patulibacter sp. TaxID=1912859 RepID=UPI0027285338|nr:ATP-binding protein [Patulibacter sp.]MDO9409764.1 ATP-binding protein [Patulibacter sp.]